MVFIAATIQPLDHVPLSSALEYLGSTRLLKIPEAMFIEANS